MLYLADNLYETKSKDLLSITKQKLTDFIVDNVNELLCDGAMALEICEEENNYHMCTYWISGTYDECYDFLSAIKDKKELNLMIYLIKQKYPNDKEKLKEKVNHRNYNQNGLALEMLSTILLKEYQKEDIWCSVYGCEEEDMCDFNRNHLINALNNQDSFPVMQMEDIIGAMFEEDTGYGVRNTVQPPEMYDVFAYYADELSLKENTLFDENNSIFTPDTFEYEGIVYRNKKYQEISRNAKLKGVDLLNYVEDLLKGITPENIIKDKYLNQFNDLNINLIKEDNLIIKKKSEKLINIKMFINGIENKIRTKKEIFNKDYNLPKTAMEIQNLVIDFSEEVKITIAGKEKVRNKDISALKGLFPRKELATHGLQFIKNLSHKDRNLERKTKITLELAEKQSLYILKKTMRLGNNIALSSSFGADSTLALYLLRKVKKNGYDIVFNNSLVEYSETIQFKNKLIKDWNLNNVIETLPYKTYWELKDENSWNFSDKGDRTINAITGKKVSSSEKCCHFIKHLPMYNLIEDKKYDVNMSGLRADESMNRLNAGKRDGVFYFASTWNLFRVNPILFWTNKMTWDYIKEKNVPYSELYDKKLLDENGKVIYEPRTGCWPCLLNAKRGYLKWMKIFKPKQYEFLMINQGLAKDLYARGMNYKIKKIENQLSLFDDEEGDMFTLNDEDLTVEQLEHFTDLIERRPCMFLK